MTTTPHSDIIATAACEHLGPLGLVRKGRSRIWLDDRSWYLILVEFQPGSWSKGSYLNVGAHFLWVPSDNLSFDLGNRVEGFHSYEDDLQFQRIGAQLAARAATEVQGIRTIITSFASVAEALRGSPIGWATLHRSVASALAGNIAEARSGFASLHSATSFPPSQSLLARLARELDSIVGDKDLFTARIGEIVQERRRTLRLAEIPWPEHGGA